MNGKQWAKFLFPAVLLAIVSVIVVAYTYPLIDKDWQLVYSSLLGGLSTNIGLIIGGLWAMRER